VSAFRVPTVLVDTREQNPWKFDGRSVRLKPMTLRFGDYSVQGMQGLVSVERKSVEDLFLTMTKGLERFERELDRARGAGVQFMAVVVEGDVQRVSLGSRWSWAQPDRVVQQLYRSCLRRGVAPYFCSGRIEAQRVAWDILHGFWASKPVGPRV
jgi:DNA excision repair protein ERCC-4